VTDRLATRFAETRAQSRAALVTFLTGGDPNLAISQAVLNALPAAGADVIEIGVPFTDPTADGPAIEAANLRALAGGISLRKILAMVVEFRTRDSTTPIILMGYTNPFLSYGAKALAADARQAGVDGLIVVDLPPEEDADLGPDLRAEGLHLIRLATPTTDAARAKTIVMGASGFLYYVSVAGITGAGTGDDIAVASAIAQLKAASELPIAVGFGIKTPERAAAVAQIADAVVVGSAIVSLIAATSADQIQKNVCDFVTSLAQAVRTAREKTAA
jgi:tryptophan synthase alpha chain